MSAIVSHLGSTQWMSHLRKSMVLTVMANDCNDLLQILRLHDNVCWTLLAREVSLHGSAEILHVAMSCRTNSRSVSMGG